MPMKDEVNKDVNDTLGSSSELSQSTSKRSYVPQVVEVVDDVDVGVISQPENNDFQMQEKKPEKFVSSNDFPMKLPLDSRAVDKNVEAVVSPPSPKAKDNEPESIDETNKVFEKDPVKDEVVGEFFQQNTTVGYPDISVHKQSRFKNIFIWGIVLLAIFGAIGAVIAFFGQGSVTLSTVPITPVESQPTTEVPAEAVVESPTPSPATSEVVKSDVSIQVLNGGGVKGAAGLMKTLLENAGYTVENVGNAAEYTYESTEIYVKPDLEAYLTVLENDIKSEYIVGKKEATLEDDVPYDVRIIVGSEEATSE